MFKIITAGSETKIRFMIDPREVVAIAVMGKSVVFNTKYQGIGFQCENPRTPQKIMEGMYEMMTDGTCTEWCVIDD